MVNKRVLFFFIISLFFTGVRADRIFYIINYLDIPIWMAAIGNPNPDFGDGYAPPHSVIELTVPDNWASARIWGRTGCDFENGELCETGDCGSGRDDCDGLSGEPPVTLAEMTLNGGVTGNQDFYDISNVDGYNLPLQMVPVTGTYEGDSSGYYCTSAGCFEDLNESCLPDNRIINDDGEVVACRNTVVQAAEAAGIGEHDSEGYASLEEYQLFKQACPDAYAYPYDDAASTFTCNGGPDYKIIFGWDDIHNLPPDIIFNNPEDGENYESPGQITIEVYMEDLDGDIVEYELFVNGTTLDGPQAGVEGDVSTTWTPAESGTYTISAVVEDNEGLVDTARITISIGEIIPVYACSLDVKDNSGDVIASPFTVSYGSDFTVEVTDDTLPEGSNTRTVTAVNSRTGGSMDITLNRQGSSDIFASGTINTGNGDIAMDYGDTLRFTYTDPDDNDDSQEKYILILPRFNSTLIVKDGNGDEITSPFEVSFNSDITVEVTDDTLPAGSDTRTVTAVNSSTGGSVDITLNRQVSSDLFVSGTVNTGSGDIAMDYGDTLRLTYTDPYDGSDTQAMYIYIRDELHITSAAAYDFDHDQIPDSLSITLSDEFGGNKILNSVIIDYNGVSDTVLASNVWMSGTNMRIPMDVSLQDFTPEGTVILVIDNFGIKITESSEFTDGIGPEIIEASIVEQFGTDYPADSLYITFAEPVNNPGTSWIYNVYDDRNLLGSFPFVTGVENSSGNTWLYILQAPQPVNDGMGLQIITRSDLSDTAGNIAYEGVHDTVIIGLIERALPVESAWYIDGNGDGVIDSLFLKFPRAPGALEGIDVSVEWTESGRGGSVEGLVYTSGDSSVISGRVTSSFGVRTGGSMDVSVLFEESGSLSQATAADSAAPVLTSAKYTPGVKNSSGIYGPDTLRVVFSENVQDITYERPFLFAVYEDSSEYEISISPENLDGNSYTFIVDDISGFDYPADGDWIWIDGNDGVRDTAGVRQGVLDNKGVRMTVVPQPYSVTAAAYPNPFTPGESDIPVSGSSVSKGVAIEILPQSKNKVAGDITIRVSIYDAVGNMLIKYDGSETIDGTIEIIRDVDRDKVWLLWSGAKINGRFVGPGTYAVIVDAQNNDGRINSVKFKIGVK